MNDSIERPRRISIGKIVLIAVAVLLMVPFVAIPFYIDWNPTATRAAYIDQPSVGDVYLVDMEKIRPGMYDDLGGNAFTGIRLVRVDGDTFYFETAKMAWNLKSGIRDEYRRDEIFWERDDVMWLSRSELHEHSGSGAVFRIEREDNPSTSSKGESSQ